MFQVQPTPFDGPGCTYLNASTAHNAMNVLLADGSVRAVSRAVSPTTWWLALVPNDGLAMPDDW
jgi:prepilin-type processing-associated H-X9-DG protein